MTLMYGATADDDAVPPMTLAQRGFHAAYPGEVILEMADYGGVTMVRSARRASFWRPDGTEGLKALQPSRAS